MCRAAGVLVGAPAYVREAGRYWKIFVPRLRCARCGVSHALLPAFTLAWRLDVAETIGSVVGEVVAGGGCGVRPAAERAGVPYTTARGLVRRFRARAAELGVAFAAVAVELGGQAVTPPAGAGRFALTAIGAAFAAAACLSGWGRILTRASLMRRAVSGQHELSQPQPPNRVRAAVVCARSPVHKPRQKGPFQHWKGPLTW